MQVRHQEEAAEGAITILPKRRSIVEFDTYFRLVAVLVSFFSWFKIFCCHALTISDRFLDLWECVYDVDHR